MPPIPLPRRADVGDAYESLAKLFEMGHKPAIVLSGQLYIEGAGLTYTIVPKGTKVPPSDGGAQDPGIPRAAGSSLTFSRDEGWDLGEVFVRETVAAAGAVVKFQGYLQEAPRAGQ